MTTEEVKKLMERVEALEKYVVELENMNVQIMFFIQTVLDHNERVYH